MLENEAAKKWCWRSIGGTLNTCYTTDCMAWEVTTVPRHEEVPHVDGKEGTWRKYVGRKPADPPAGYCSALPPDPQ